MTARPTAAHFRRALLVSLWVGLSVSARAQSAPLAGTPDWIPIAGGLAGTNGPVRTQAVFDDGSGTALYVGGAFSVAGGLPADGLARYDGHKWSLVDGWQGGVVEDLRVFDDGSGPALYVAGDFTAVGGFPASHVARWDGATWAALGVGVDAPAYALAVYDDGSGDALYVGGAFVDAGGQAAAHVARWDGAAWAGLGSGVDADVRALRGFDDGSGEALYVGGSFALAGGQPAAFVARWDGSAWSSLGSPLNGEVAAFEVFDPGSGAGLYAGGTFTQAGAQSVLRLARWGGLDWEHPGLGFYDSGEFVEDLLAFDDGDGPALYVAGTFSWAVWNGGQSFAANGVVRFDGHVAQPLGEGVGNVGSSLAVFDDGEGAALHVGGNFNELKQAPCSRIGKWSGAGWLPLGAGIDSPVLAVESLDLGGGPRLYAGGGFDVIGGEPASIVATWNGAQWQQFGQGLDGIAQALEACDTGAGPQLYAAGSFVTPFPLPWANIARWSGTAWQMLSDPTDSGQAWTLEAFDDGGGEALYAAGNLNRIGGQSVEAIARWNGSSWSPLAGGGVDSWVRALQSFDDGSGPALFVGGFFANAGGVPARAIARWDGVAWSALGGGLSMACQVCVRVEALAVYDDGSGTALYVAGTFETAGGLPANHIARWDGTAWSTVGGGVSGPSPRVAALAVLDLGGGPQLYAAGEFDHAGGVPARNLARWDGSVWSEVGGGLEFPVQSMAALPRPTGDLLVLAGFFDAGPASSSHLTAWGVPIPSSGLNYCTAGTTTNGCMAAMSGSGAASAGAGSGFTLTASGVEGQRVGLFLYGVSGTASLPWGVGGTSTLCVQPPAQRLSGANSGGTPGLCDGSFSQDWNAFVAGDPTAVGQPFEGGETVWAQAWFRDPGAPKDSNLSDGLAFTVLP